MAGKDAAKSAPGSNKKPSAANRKAAEEDKEGKPFIINEGNW